VHAAGWTDHNIGAEKLLGLALERALHIRDCAVEIACDPERHLLPFVPAIFRFLPDGSDPARLRPPKIASGYGSAWHDAWTDHGDMSTGAWRLIGLACTLLALILVN
jgi:hypothetical protein